MSDLLGQVSGLASYLAFLLTMAGIYGVLTLGLNLQWGMTGLFNIGIAAFFAVGAYASALVTMPPSPAHIAGWMLPVPLGMIIAMLAAGALAWAIGRLTLRLRSDYLAIASIGIAESLRLALKNEDWFGNGVRGLSGIPRACGEQIIVYLLVIAALLAGLYLLLRHLTASPWGRVLRAIRENEAGAAAAGKDVNAFRLQGFIAGAMLMGLAGALYAHFIGFVSPEAFEPIFGTFLVWVMLIVGGSGSHRGAILGAVLVWLLWSASEFLTSRLPDDIIARSGGLRLILIGGGLVLMLLHRPQGLIPEDDDNSSSLRWGHPGKHQRAG